MDNKNNAGFGIRALALITDGLLNVYPFTIILALSSLTYFFEKNSENALFIMGCIFLTLSLILAPLLLLYTVYFTSAYGGTIGKLIFGLKIVDKENGKTIDRKTSFYRTILGYMFSSQMAGLGFLKVLKSPEKLAWHDELFGTKVVSSRNTLVGTITALIIIAVGCVLCAYTVFYVLGLTSSGLEGFMTL